MLVPQPLVSCHGAMPVMSLGTPSKCLAGPLLERGFGIVEEPMEDGHVRRWGLRAPRSRRLWPGQRCAGAAAEQTQALEQTYIDAGVRPPVLQVRNGGVDVSREPRNWPRQCGTIGLAGPPRLVHLNATFAVAQLDYDAPQWSRPDPCSGPDPKECHPCAVLFDY